LNSFGEAHLSPLVLLVACQSAQPAEVKQHRASEG
jgi:hypothetical protein